MSGAVPQAVQAARFVAVRCGFTEAEPTASTSGQVQLGSLVGLATIVRYMVSSSQALHLLGSSPEIEAQVRVAGAVCSA